MSHPSGCPIRLAVRRTKCGNSTSWSGLFEFRRPRAIIESPHHGLWRWRGGGAVQKRGEASVCVAVGANPTSCTGVGLRVSGMRGRTEGKTKTNHNEGCGSFSGRTDWASHFLGPPWCVSLPNSSIERYALCSSSFARSSSSSSFALPSLSITLSSSSFAFLGRSPSRSTGRPCHAPGRPSSSVKRRAPPTSLWRGEGRLRLGPAGVLVVEPTSLRRGEGLAAGLLCVVGRELGWRRW